MAERALARSYQFVVNFELQDADALAEQLSQRFSEAKITPVTPDHRVGMSGTYGAVAGIDFSRNEVRGEFRLTPRQHHDGVFFFFPTAGRMVFHQALQSFASSPTTAVAAEGTACNSVDFLSDHAFCSVVIDRPRITERLSVLLDRPIVEKPVFEPSMDMTLGSASALRSLVMYVTGPEFGPQLNRASLTAERVRETLVDLALEVWPNNYSEMLDRPPPMIAPQHVKLAIDFIHDYADAIPSGTELAALSGVSLRALQAGFRRFVGVSIGAYQRQIRLERARADMLKDPSVPIETISLRWGFTNAGRFSRYFKAAYGVLPTELVRGRR